MSPETLRVLRFCHKYLKPLAFNKPYTFNTVNYMLTPGNEVPTLEEIKALEQEIAWAEFNQSKSNGYSDNATD